MSKNLVSGGSDLLKLDEIWNLWIGDSLHFGLLGSDTVCLARG